MSVEQDTPAAEAEPAPPPPSRSKLVEQAAKPARRFGDLLAMFVDSVTVTVTAIARRRFAWWDCLEQARFLISVSALPTILIAIPFGLVLVLEVGGLTSQVGATSMVGGVTSVAIVREAAPIITGIVLAGAGGSAICADLGARTTRSEIAALRVMAIDPLERLVGPRIVATMFVAVLLNGIVSFVGIITGYLTHVHVLHGSAGGFLTSFSAFAQSADLYQSCLKAALFGLIAAVVASFQGLNCDRGPAGVGEAVNRSVVVTGVTLFLVNLVITQVFLVTVPPVLL